MSLALTGVEAINATATDIESLAPQLVSAAVRVHQAPTDASCTAHLSQLRKEWTAQLQVLTSLVDDITDYNDFVLMTGNVFCFHLMGMHRHVKFQSLLIIISYKIMFCQRISQPVENLCKNSDERCGSF